MKKLKFIHAVFVVQIVGIGNALKSLKVLQKKIICYLRSVKTVVVPHTKVFNLATQAIGGKYGNVQKQYKI